VVERMKRSLSPRWCQMEYNNLPYALHKIR
jgi:hypothetical protein